MSMGDRGWRDSTENYCDGYILRSSASTSDNVIAPGTANIQPGAVFGLSITTNPSIGSGLVELMDSSATGNADTTVWSVRIASAASQVFQYDMAFPRGLAFNNGIVVTAATVTGSISILYKARYS